MKTHYHSDNTVGQFGRMLFCSGRSVRVAMTSHNLDDVDCAACRRKLLAAAVRVVQS